MKALTHLYTKRPGRNHSWKNPKNQGMLDRATCREQAPKQDLWRIRRQRWQPLVFTCRNASEELSVASFFVIFRLRLLQVVRSGLRIFTQRIGNKRFRLFKKPVKTQGIILQKNSSPLNPPFTAPNPLSDDNHSSDLTANGCPLLFAEPRWETINPTSTPSSAPTRQVTGLQRR
jgi:hypothetical protein